MVDAIDRFDEHVNAAGRFAEMARLAQRVRLISGEAGDVLGCLHEGYDFVHDDAWFAAQPSYFDRVVHLLKPGRLLTIPNWFLLTDAISNTGHDTWASFCRTFWEVATR
jgi:predicted O-methyltransferase YrrM